MLLMWGRQACTGAVVRVTQLGLGADRCRCQVPLKRDSKGPHQACALAAVTGCQAQSSIADEQSVYS